MNPALFPTWSKIMYMRAKLSRTFVQAAFFASCLVLGICFARCASAANALPITDEATADREQLVSEVAAVGSDVLRARLLESARGNRGEQNLAHWYAGEIERGGRWLSLEAAQQEAETNDSLSEYRRKRDAIADTGGDHENLARWCQKQKLMEQAKVHWLHLLRFQPQHRAALKELNLRWYEGTLLADDEIKNVQARQREFQKRQRQWKTKAKKLRRALEHGEPEERQAARVEIRQIDEPAAVPALLEEFAEKAGTEEKTTERQSQLMSALGGINDPAAVETLLDFAVSSPREKVRYAAVNQLKSKPLHEYVPILLSEMRLPVEASVTHNQIGAQIVSTYSYGQEGPADQLYETSEKSYRTIPGQRYVAAPIYRKRLVPSKLIREAYDIPEWYHDASRCGGHIVPAHTHPAKHVPAVYSKERIEYDLADIKYGEHPDYQFNKQETAQQSQAQAAGVARQVNQFNQALARQNEQISHVLTEVTGQTLDAYPKSWWNWWSDYLDRHPDLAASGGRQQLNMLLLNQEPRGLARGTWVWTLQGRQPVESIRPGDFVLAQNPDSGELAYKVVLTIAAPHPTLVVKVDLTESSLHCAPGHVVWTAGAGWQPIGKLQTGDPLHGVYAEPQIDRTHEPFTIDSYDLIVDGFHTFFVGEQGILVHDATPIAPTYVALPGFSSAAVVNAARLAAVAQ